jgi:hypothetical protein
MFSFVLYALFRFVSETPPREFRSGPERVTVDYDDQDVPQNYQAASDGKDGDHSTDAATCEEQHDLRKMSNWTGTAVQAELRQKWIDAWLHVRARTRQGLPESFEHWPQFQWSRASWELMPGGTAEFPENRSHFRNHYPLFTLQTLWDHADQLFQDSQPDIPWFPARYKKEDAAKIRNGDVIFLRGTGTPDESVDVFLRTIVKHIPQSIHYSILIFNGDTPFCGSIVEELTLLANVDHIYSSNACPGNKIVQLPLGIEDNFEFPAKSAWHSWKFHGNVTKFSAFMAIAVTQPKTRGVYCNINVATNPEARGPALAYFEELAHTCGPNNSLDVTIAGRAVDTNDVEGGWHTYLRTVAMHR